MYDELGLEMKVDPYALKLLFPGLATFFSGRQNLTEA